MPLIKLSKKNIAPTVSPIDLKKHAPGNSSSMPDSDNVKKLSLPELYCNFKDKCEQFAHLIILPLIISISSVMLYFFMIITYDNGSPDSGNDIESNHIVGLFGIEIGNATLPDFAKIVQENEYAKLYQITRDVSAKVKSDIIKIGVNKEGGKVYAIERHLTFDSDLTCIRAVGILKDELKTKYANLRGYFFSKWDFIDGDRKILIKSNCVSSPFNKSRNFQVEILTIDSSLRPDINSKKAQELKKLLLTEY